jgi:hypothetical protein
LLRIGLSLKLEQSKNRHQKNQKYNKIFYYEDRRGDYEGNEGCLGSWVAFFVPGSKFKC